MDKDETTTPETEKPKTVQDAILNTATAVKALMSHPYGFNFAQAWSIVKDGMDRQQHYADNQVALLLGGFQDIKTTDDDDNDNNIISIVPDEEGMPN